jgi:hypothetical protein
MDTKKIQETFFYSHKFLYISTMGLETYIIGCEFMGLNSHKESGHDGLLKVEAYDEEHVLDKLKHEYDWGDYEPGGTFGDRWYFPRDNQLVTIQLIEDINEL